MKQRRILPSRLATLRERDPAGFIEACRRGGKESAKRRLIRANKEKAEAARIAQIEADIRITLEAFAWEQKLREMGRLANERGDHLLPDP